MSEYLCLTLIAEAGETESAFKTRLTAFWSHLIRTQPDTYEAVYAEAKHFDATGGRVSRQYMVGEGATSAVLEALTTKGIAAAPVDTDDTYTKYEASGSEWFQIAH
ncbi:hypothetical protein J8F10_12925 [Gemmata sp. G18]|uniref:Uncharacterized protein n=1 Tax=Gemmata palustris TaxID=2822762 RepID=A0ABS5BRZ8_9BACT|nr:hypothetical protein [Gemmata palustris]MBP3956187.1 hypothetical protein [Gemmata palustris]